MFPLQQMNVKTNVQVRLQKAKRIFWAEGAFKFAFEGIWVSSLKLLLPHKYRKVFIYLRGLKVENMFLSN